MDTIKIYGELENVASSGVLANSKQIKGAYMTLTTAEREALKDALKVGGMRVYDTTLKADYRWNNETQEWDLIPSGGSQPENFLVSASVSEDQKTLTILSNKGTKVEFQGGGNIFEEITEIPESPSSQVIYIYKHTHELENIELQVPFNFTTYAKSEAVNIKWNEDYTQLSATVYGKEMTFSMSELLELYESEQSQYVFIDHDVSEPETDYQVPLFYPSESAETFDVGLFSYIDTTVLSKFERVFAHTESDVKVTTTSLYQYYNKTFQPLMITVDYDNIDNKPTLNGVTIESNKSSEDYSLFRTKVVYNTGEIGDQSIMALLKEEGVVTNVDIINVAYTQYGIDHELTLHDEDGKKYFTYTLNDEIITVSSDDVINDYRGDRGYFTWDISEDSKLFLLGAESDITFKIDEITYSGQEEINYSLLNINEADPEVKTAETTGAYVTDTDGEVQELLLTKNLPLNYTEVDIVITLNLTHLSCDLGTEIKATPGEIITGTLTADEGYGLPSSITVSSSIQSYKYDEDKGQFTLEVPFVDSTVTAEARYGIQPNVTNGEMTLSSLYIGKGEIVTATITSDEHYTLPTEISVQNCSYTYNSATGAVRLYNPTEIVTIEVNCVPESYNILKNLEHFGSDDIPDTISYGSTVKCTINAQTGYALPDSIEVTGCTYTYNSTTGAITLSNPQGEVTISATAVLNVIRFTAQDAGAKVYLTVDYRKYMNEGSYEIGTGTLTDAITLYYSTDDGATWNTFFSGKTGTSEIITLENVGDSVLIYGDNSTFGTYNTSTFFASPSFKTTDGKVAVEGKVSGLVRGTEYLTAYMFFGLFHDNTNIVSAPELNMVYYKREAAPEGCYGMIFYNCYNLVEGPKSMIDQWFNSYMFYQAFYCCRSLVRPPLLNDVEPDPSYSRTLKRGFTQCFYGCSSLNITTDSTKGTKFFTAYTVIGQSVDNNYDNMFYGVGGGASSTPSIDVPYYYY